MSNTEPTANDLATTTAAARQVLNNGWWLFALPPHCKVPYKGSKAHLDALNTEAALKPWLEGTAANPAVALKASNLTVLDIDQGLGSNEHALDFATRTLRVQTMIVKSHRGYHFYFEGTRELPNAQNEKKYVSGGISGELKSNGYVMAVGSIHPEGDT